MAPWSLTNGILDIVYACVFNKAAYVDGYHVEVNAKFKGKMSSTHIFIPNEDIDLVIGSHVYLIKPHILRRGMSKSSFKVKSQPAITVGQVEKET